MAGQTTTELKEPKKGRKKKPKKVGVPHDVPLQTQPEWYKLSVEEVFRRLNTGPNGLSDTEASERLKKYGPNELTEKKKTPAWIQFLKQFTQVLIIILLVATAVSAALGEYLDAGVIFAVVSLNAVMGFMHERKAEKAVEALKKMLVPKAKVFREGTIKVEESRSVVQGDIMILEAGERITADCRIMEALHLKVNESVLTGESVPVEKNPDVISESATLPERKNMLFSGTTAVYGHCKAIVTSTGMQTEFGKIAAMLQEEEKESTPLQKRLKRLGRLLGIIILVICAAVLGTGIARAGIGDREQLITLFLTAVALAVAAMPVALPTVVTITLAMGLTRMAKRNAILRKLLAVETLGSATAICTDKTGTLTVNEMTVKKILADGKILDVTGKGYDKEGELLNNGQWVEPSEGVRLLLETGLLCNNASLGETPVGDPTEIALLVSATKAGLPDLRRYHDRLDEIPFDSERKKMSVICTTEGKTLMHTKGAVEKVLDNCTHIYRDGEIRGLTQEDIDHIQKINHLFAVDALRVLAFARKELKEGEHLEERGLVFLGLQGMIDPPRPEVKDAYQECKEAGLRVVMITGDHKDTAAAVAREIGILDEGTILTGAELDALGDEEYARIAPEVRVYARVSPQHKVRITDTHKKMGHIVAMTGDGINDAPALKRADIGVAMGITGTDVTKEASDMVLADDNFATIVSAIEEGRGIYENIRKFVYYLLSSNFAEVITIFAATMLNMPLPLLPVQLLWINLVTDGLPAFALGVEPYELQIMKRPPRDPKEGIITKGIIIYLVAVGFVVAAATLSLFYLGVNVDEARTVAFTFFVVVEQFIAYNFRTFGPFYKASFISNRQLLIAYAISFPLQVSIVYVPFLNPIFHTVPLPWWTWLEIIGASFVVFGIVEGIKALLLRFEKAARRRRPPKKVRLRVTRERREGWPGRRWAW
jgi:Ca2+-transporting ATPase